MTVLLGIQIIMLIMAVVLSIALAIFALIKAIKEGFTNKWIALLVFSLGLLFIIYWAYYVRQIEPADHLQIMLMLGLVTVTGIYAFLTARQADASVKMAEEMANTRYDTFRPIIDIVEVSMEAKEIYKHAFEAKEGKFPENLPCKLRNIGVGPAIGVSSFIVVPSNGEQQPWDFGTLAVKEETSEFRLSLQQIGDRMFLVVYYKDVYGRDIESRREVSLDKEKHGWKIHPLETQVRKIAKDGAHQ